MASEKKEKVLKYFTLDQEKHVITVDTSIAPTKSDTEAVKLYVSMGYAMRIKSQTRAALMKAKADSLNDKAIREALKDNKEELAKYDAILHGTETNDDGKTGFFAAKKHAKKIIEAMKKKEEKK